MAAKSDHDKFMPTAATAEPRDSIAYNKQSKKRTRQPSGEELLGGARKTKILLIPRVKISNVAKLDPCQASRKARKGEPEEGSFAGFQSRQVRASQGQVNHARYKWKP